MEYLTVKTKRPRRHTIDAFPDRKRERRSSSLKLPESLHKWHFRNYHFIDLPGERGDASGLPPELWSAIFEEVGKPGLLAVTAVSKYWRKLAVPVIESILKPFRLSVDQQPPSFGLIFKTFSPTPIVRVRVQNKETAAIKIKAVLVSTIGRGELLEHKYGLLGYIAELTWVANNECIAEFDKLMLSPYLKPNGGVMANTFFLKFTIVEALTHETIENASVVSNPIQVIWKNDAAPVAEMEQLNISA